VTAAKVTTTRVRRGGAIAVTPTWLVVPGSAGGRAISYREIASQRGQHEKPSNRIASSLRRDYTWV
jgi:hypothetical protein